MEKNITIIVFRAVSTLPVTLTEEEAGTIVARVVAAKPRNLQGFAYAAARNFAIDKMRSARRASRRQAERLATAERERIKCEAFELARSELLQVVAKLSGEVRESQLRHLGMVIFAKLERRPDREIAERFPGSTPNQRFQWTRRGMKLVWPLVSEHVRSLLLRHHLQGGEL